MLTDVQIRTARPKDKPYKITDSHGLHIQVTPNGSKLWRFRYRFNNKESMLSLGEYPTITLSDARDARDKTRKLLKQGIDPALHRRQQKQRQSSDQANTFEAIARELIERKTWSELTHSENMRIFESDIFPKIGKMPIKDIMPPDVLNIIQTAERRGAISIAVKIRGMVGEVFRYGCSTLRCNSDPAATLRGAIQVPPVEHAKPFSRQEIAVLLDKLDNYDGGKRYTGKRTDGKINGGTRLVAIAMNLLLLTFVRTTEIQSAKWNQFDFERKTWKPKMKRVRGQEVEHIVPLSQQVLTLLEELKNITGDKLWLFPHARDPKNHMQRTTFNRALEAMGMDNHSGHDFRATASTFLNEMGYRSEIIEKQLAHEERNRIRAAYNHAQYLEERFVMMQKYSDFIYGLRQSTV